MSTLSHSFNAHWTDGRTAATYPATVTLARAVEILPAGATEPVLWSFHRTEASVPLWPSSDHVLLRSMDHPGQTLLVEDAGFAPALLGLAPHLKAGSKRWRDLRPGLSVAAVVALIVGSVVAFDLSPATYVASLIPKQARVMAGQQVLEVVTQGSGLCSSPEGNAALQTLMSKIKTAAGTDTDFNIVAVNWDLVNAFALPGEQIIVTRGLIDKAQSAEEVAGVVAHEMGHGIELHPEAGMVRAIGMAAAAELVFTGSSGTIGNFGQQMLELNYSRNAESRADDQAVRLLKAAQISPVPLSEFFDRLSKEMGETDDASTASKLFSTHPPSPDRAKLFKEAATYDTVPALTPAEWSALKAICAAEPTVTDTPQPELPADDGTSPPPDPNGQPPLPPT
ncbi:MAG: M48 family metallopeptidase [Hyphomicrobiaceae bacterium]